MDGMISPNGGGPIGSNTGMPSNDSFGDPHAYSPGASTSISHVGSDNDNGPSTSIGHMDDDEGAATSINSLGRQGAQTSALGPQTQDEEDASRSWYHARESQKEKETAESVEARIARKEKEDPYSLHLGGTGRKGLTDRGRRGFKRRMNKYMHHHRRSYAGLSHKDKDALHDVIVQRVKQKSWGSDINYKDRRRMKQDVQKMYNRREISRTDRNQMKKVIDRLEKD